MTAGPRLIEIVMIKNRWVRLIIAKYINKSIYYN